MSRKAKPVVTSDGWVNVLTGIGDTMRDKRESTKIGLRTISYDALMALYRSSDLAGRIVDLPAEEMTREGFDVRVEGDEESAELIGAAMDDLDVGCVLLQALKWKRLFGGAAILVGANDGSTDLSLPLNEEKIQSIDFLTVFDAWEARVLSYYENPATKEFGQPEFYQLAPHAVTQGISILQKVHASRVIRFSGPLASRRQLRMPSSGIGQGWGDSVLLRVSELLRDYDTSWQGISALMQDFAQTVYKIQGLAQALLSEKGEGAIKRRMASIDMSRSVIKAVLLDKDGEDFERKSTVLSGVPETMDKFAIRLAAAAQMPATVLFGQSPAGLGATGASDIRFFYDSIRAQQTRDLKPALCRLACLLMKAKNGPTGGVEPEEWNIQFRSLWQLTDSEKADVREKMSRVDQAYLNMGVLSTLDIAESRFGGDEYSLETQVDTDALEERDAVAAEQTDLSLEGQRQALEAPPVPAEKKPVE